MISAKQMKRILEMLRQEDQLEAEKFIETARAAAVAESVRKLKLKGGLSRERIIALWMQFLL